MAQQIMFKFSLNITASLVEKKNKPLSISTMLLFSMKTDLLFLGVGSFGVVIMCGYLNSSYHCNLKYLICFVTISSKFSLCAGAESGGEKCT